MLSTPASFWTLRGAPNTASLSLALASSQYAAYGGAFGDFTVAGTSLTLERWVKHTTSAGTMYYESLPNSWSIFRAGDNTLRWQVFNGAGGTNHVGWNENPPVGTWRHYAFSWDGTLTVAGGAMKFYIDGVDQGAPDTVITANNIVSLGAAAGAYAIGAVNSLGYTNFFDGLMDEQRIWTAVRTAPQILANYRKQIDPATAGLRNYYQWNGSVFTDVSGGLNLTGFNGAGFSVDVPFAIG